MAATALQGVVAVGAAGAVVSLMVSMVLDRLSVKVVVVVVVVTRAPAQDGMQAQTLQAYQLQPLLSADQPKAHIHYHSMITMLLNFTSRQCLSPL